MRAARRAKARVRRPTAFTAPGLPLYAGTAPLLAVHTASPIPSITSCFFETDRCFIRGIDCHHNIGRGR
jgi:hypothetical protein